MHYVCPASAFVQRCEFIQELPDDNVLGIDPFASAALETFRCPGMIHGIALIIHIGLFAGDGIQIQQSEIIRYIHLDRTFFHTVSAGGAENSDRTVEDIRDLCSKFLFPFCQRTEFLHIACIVLQLAYVAHAAQYDFHFRQRRRKAYGKRCLGRTRFFVLIIRIERTGSWASVPPLTGSMTMTFLPCLTAVS